MRGGNLTVNATESVEVIGATPFDFLASGLYTGPQQTATGNSGDLTINTAKLIVRDGGQVSAATFGAGDVLLFLLIRLAHLPIKLSKPKGG